MFGLQAERDWLADGVVARPKKAQII